MSNDDSTEGMARKVVRMASSDGSVVSYRAVVGALAFLCAGLSGFIANAVVEQGKQLAIIIDSRQTNLQRLTSVEHTLTDHSAKIDAGLVQEHNDTAVLQQQIQGIMQKLDDVHRESSVKFDNIQTQLDAAKTAAQTQDEKITNLGVAVARIRGVRGN